MRFDSNKATRSTLIAILSLAVMLVAAGHGRADITIKNDTYSPMHYRIRTPEGDFSQWETLLPGETARYGGHTSLVAEIWWRKDLTKKFALPEGGYSWYRNEPTGDPEFSSYSGGPSLVPAPPTSPSSQLQFAPLQAFIAHCKKYEQPYQLSLKKLARECADAQAAGALPTHLRYVHGFTWFFGYVVDERNDDVILLGIKDSTRPPLDVDCLATAIKSATAGTAPYCSLDDHPDPDYSKSVVAGVPWNTRYAEVMIQADYEMGRIAGGSLRPSIPGFKSQRDLFAEVLSTQGLKGEGTSSVDGKRSYENRWWFNFDSDVPRAVADPTGKILYLHKNPVRLSTEQKVNGAYGTGQTTLSNRLFVASFNKHMESLGKNFPSIAELQSLYRLYDVMKHLREVGKTDVPEKHFWISTYKHPYAGPPEKMAKIPNSRTIKVREDVPRPAAGASYVGTETLTGYNRLAFDLHANGRATMHDADGTTHGSWEASGTNVTLRFYNGTVVYVGSWNGDSLAGAAANAKTTWRWNLNKGYIMETWTSK